MPILPRCRILHTASIPVASPLPLSCRPGDAPESVIALRASTQAAIAADDDTNSLDQPPRSSASPAIGPVPRIEHGLPVRALARGGRLRSGDALGTLAATRARAPGSPRRGAASCRLGSTASASGRQIAFEHAAKRVERLSQLDHAALDRLAERRNVATTRAFPCCHDGTPFVNAKQRASFRKVPRLAPRAA